MIMQAVFNGVVLAESDNTVVVEGNHYFARESLQMEFIEPTRSHTVCPWKGLAWYYTVSVNGATSPDAAWSYPLPSPLARKIKGRIAFWRGVQVSPAAAVGVEQAPVGTIRDAEEPARSRQQVVRPKNTVTPSSANS